MLSGAGVSSASGASDTGVSLCALAENVAADHTVADIYEEIDSTDWLISVLGAQEAAWV